MGLRAIEDARRARTAHFWITIDDFDAELLLRLVASSGQGAFADILCGLLTRQILHLLHQKKIWISCMHQYKRS